MSTIDRQLIAAVRKLEQLSFTFIAGDWAGVRKFQHSDSETSSPVLC